MTKLIGIVLLAAGTLALAYGGLASQAAHEASLGPLEVTAALGFVGGGLLVRRRA